MTAKEQRYWELDQTINDRGVPIDMELVNSALRLDRRYKAQLKAEMKVVTGLGNPGSNPQFLSWLRGNYDPAVENVKKETITWILANSPAEKIRKACELKQEISKTSNSKYTSIKKATGTDLRLRNLLQFYGAQRTGRRAGRGPQFHNLPSSMTDDPELYAAMVESIFTENPDFIRSIWGVSPSRILSQSIRGTIKAPEGRKLVVGDWGSIESRILGWLAGCERVNRLFAEGLDTYKDFAVELFGVPYDQVTKKQRKFSKPPVLGCGYMLGWRGLIKYSEGYGVQMDEASARRAVEIYRGVYPEVKALWSNYMAAIEMALSNPDQWYETGRVKIGKYREMLLIYLPCGRYLHYYKPLWQQIPAPWDATRLTWAFTYEGTDSDDNYKWGRISAHGGKITENIDQALAGEILSEGLMMAEARGVNPILDVHDEIVGEVNESEAERISRILRGVMQESPSWAPDLLLDGSVWTGDRYRKD